MFDTEEILRQTQQQLNLVEDDYTLNIAKSKLLGSSSQVQQIATSLQSLDHQQRKILGQKFNTLKNEITKLLVAKKRQLEQQALEQQLAAEELNITLPGRERMKGSIHLISRTIMEMATIFKAFGYSLVEGPNVESEKHNFDALNIPVDHPARQMHDTFYLSAGKLLRTHTSTVQIREMPKHQPPFRLLAHGRVYRKDHDATHTPMFHQIEGMQVDRNVTMGNLKFLMYEFVRIFFAGKAEVRFRPSYFPFTEPSAEVDIRFNSADCWLEIMGGGMIHPTVMQNVGISTEFSGFALGLGVERCAMLKYGIDDVRYLFNSNVSWLKANSFSPFSIHDL